MKTVDWARSFGIEVSDLIPGVSDYNEPCLRSAQEIARRTLVLQGMVAVACGVDAQPVRSWLKAQGLWPATSPFEQRFLIDGSALDQERAEVHWRQEALWTLLWCIGKVEYLGLPTTCCDTARIVDEIVPSLGSKVMGYIVGAQVRPSGALLAEDDRSYDLWCRALSAKRKGEELPVDLNWNVLFQRRYAFEWLDGNQNWDKVTCDA